MGAEQVLGYTKGTTLPGQGSEGHHVTFTTPSYKLIPKHPHSETASVSGQALAAGASQTHTSLSLDSECHWPHQEAVDDPWTLGC